MGYELLALAAHHRAVVQPDGGGPANVTALTTFRRVVDTVKHCLNVKLMTFLRAHFHILP